MVHPYAQDVKQRWQQACVNEQDAPDKTQTKKQKQGQVTQEEAKHCAYREGVRKVRSPLGVEFGKGQQVQQDRQKEWLLEVHQELNEDKTRQGVNLLLNGAVDLVTKDTKNTLVVCAFFTDKTCLQESQALRSGVRKTYPQ